MAIIIEIIINLAKFLEGWDKLDKSILTLLKN